MKNHSTTHAWTRIAVYDNPSPAKTLQAFLEAQGFTPRVKDERNLQRYWFLTTPRAGVYVEVPEESLTAAKNYLASHEEGVLLLRAAIRCPSCQSLRVEYPQMTRKNILPTLVAHALVATHLMEPECYCQDCHYTWNARYRHRKSRDSKKLRTLAETESVSPKLSHARLR